jgi:hypothetical protein
VTTTISLLLLPQILLLLAVPTTHTLGCQTLFAKGSPWSKVLAALAPLDFQFFLAHGDNDPDCNIAGRADSLILTRDNVHGVKVVAVVHSRRSAVGLTRNTRGGGAKAEFSAHDAVLLAFGCRVASLVHGGTALGNVVGVVDEQVKVGKLDIVRLVAFTANGKKTILLGERVLRARNGKKYM